MKEDTQGKLDSFEKLLYICSNSPFPSIDLNDCTVQKTLRLFKAKVVDKVLAYHFPPLCHGLSYFKGMLGINGMYLLSNFPCISAASPLWKKTLIGALVH